MKPTVGRIVHYITEGEEPRAAMVVAVRSKTIDLQVFLTGRDGSQLVTQVAKGEWEWPKRSAT